MALSMEQKFIFLWWCMFCDGTKKALVKTSVVSQATFNCINCNFLFWMAAWQMDGVILQNSGSVLSTGRASTEWIGFCGGPEYVHCHRITTPSVYLEQTTFFELQSSVLISFLNPGMLLQAVCMCFLLA